MKEKYNFKFIEKNEKYTYKDIHVYIFFFLFNIYILYIEKTYLNINSCNPID